MINCCYNYCSICLFNRTNKTFKVMNRMCSRQVILVSSSLLVLAAVSVWAEPPTAYGPPGFSGSSVSKTSFSSSSSGGSGGGGSGGSFFSGGEGGAPEPYSYAYEVKDAPTGNDYSSTANSDGKRVTGEYRVLLPDGRRQIVKYTADDGGYNANVQYEGQARYPVAVAKSGGGGGGGASTVTIAAPGGSSGTIVAGGSTGGSSFGGYRY